MKKNYNYMKFSQIILFLVILSICSSQECTAGFDSKMREKCKNFDSSCSLDNLGCFRRDCTKAEDSTSCRRTLPLSNVNTKKCEWNDGEEKCQEADKTCFDYNKFGGEYIPNGGDICTNLRMSNGMTCFLDVDDEYGCKARYNRCQDVRTTDLTIVCNENLLVNSDFKKKCEIDETTGSCKEISGQSRLCSDAVSNTLISNFFVNDINCNKFEKSNGKNCVSFNGGCEEVFPYCKDFNYDKNTCENTHSQYKHMPVNPNGIGYNYLKKCVWDESKSDKCVEEFRLCSDYNSYIIGDGERCVNFQTTDDSKKECVYDPTKSGNSKCYEKYKKCQYFSDNTLEKSRNSCEDSATEEKCDYILRKDQCQTKKNYTSCSEYNETGEKDRIICESIISQTNHLYCVFDKDSQCIEREPYCSEVYNLDDCLHIAKATDANKKCAFGNGKCYEEYIRCEDYLETDSLNCTKIRLYNGLQCEYDSQSGRCRTRNKFCSEARTKDECKLMNKAKIGISDPDRKICGDYIYDYTYEDEDGNTLTKHNWKCAEIFKYCSDYKGSSDEECENIKPYDETGEKIDTHSKCIIENYKCQRVNKTCEDAGDNPILCSEISDKIKDNSIYYCRFDISKDKCITNYKSCEDYEETSSYGDESSSDPDIESAYNDKKNKCENNIPKDYNTGLCKYELDNNIYKCVTNKECNDFDLTKYDDICDQVDSDCHYDQNSMKCEKVEKECKKVRFFTDSDTNEDKCKKIEASVPYKICTLKEDKSGCEEIYREFSFSTAPPPDSELPGTQSEGASGMIMRIQLIITLLFLLF